MMARAASGPGRSPAAASRLRLGSTHRQKSNIHLDGLGIGSRMILRHSEPSPTWPRVGPP